MKAAPCSWRVVMWRTWPWPLSASRMSIVSSPGTEKTYSQASAARQSTRRWAAVRAPVVVTAGSLAGALARPARPAGVSASEVRVDLVDGQLVALAGLVGCQHQLASHDVVVADAVQRLLGEQPFA